jgi:hypothetical protein
MFRKLNLFPYSGGVGEKTPTQLGPVERANLSHWTRVSSPRPFICGRKEIQFPKRRVSTPKTLDDGKTLKIQ